jgi:hypothetical protein
MKKVALIGLAAAGLAGCIAIDADSPRVDGEIDVLAKNCRERGGILVPIDRGVPSANEAANWACEIHGASRIERK